MSSLRSSPLLSSKRILACDSAMRGTWAAAESKRVASDHKHASFRCGPEPGSLCVSKLTCPLQEVLWSPREQLEVAGDILPERVAWHISENIVSHNQAEGGGGVGGGVMLVLHCHVILKC